MLVTVRAVEVVEVCQALTDCHLLPLSETETRGGEGIQNVHPARFRGPARCFCVEVKNRCAVGAHCSSVDQVRAGRCWVRSIRCHFSILRVTHSVSLSWMAQIKWWRRCSENRQSRCFIWFPHRPLKDLGSSCRPKRSCGAFRIVLTSTSWPPPY